MIISVYEPLEGWLANNEIPASRNVANFVEFEKYEYHKYWRDIGSFTLVLPASAYGIGYVRPDMILFINEGDDGVVNDSLIITEVSNDGLRVTASGTDLKGLLSYRQTLFPQEEIEAGTYGHDVRQGSTGSIIAGYITYNCIEATDPGRNIPGLRIGYTGGGIENDTYMSRLQPLNEVVTALCKNADIGWDISFSMSGYTFDIIEGSDRTNATGRYKCVFADYLHNAEAITKQEKSSERRNVIWTVNGSDVDKAVVTSIYKEDQDVARGFNRRETVLTANCDLDLTEAYVDSRTADMVDKMQVSLKLTDPTMYGRSFFVGDKVTIMKGGAAYDRRIIQADKNYTAGKHEVSIQLGDIPTKKFFDKTSGDLNSRADDVKELALENAATKKTVSSISGETHYSEIDPLDPRSGCTNVKEGDLWEVLNAELCSIARYKCVSMMPSQEEEEDEPGSSGSSSLSVKATSSPAIDAGREIRELSVQHMPDKALYNRGENLKFAGCELLVKFSDGNIATLTLTDDNSISGEGVVTISVSGYDKNKYGKQTITLSYGGQTAEMEIAVQWLAWELLCRYSDLYEYKRERLYRMRITNGVECDWGG